MRGELLKCSVASRLNAKGFFTMAYLTLIASVPESEIISFEEGKIESMSASRIERVSHYLAYSVSHQPLGKLLGQAIDGGEPLREDLWHPFRAPVVKTVNDVKSCSTDLNEAWTAVTSQWNVSEGDWYRIEITKLLSIYNHASRESEYIVSILEPPADSEHVRKVKIPIALALNRTTQANTRLQRTRR
jgi:hypothetical protein